MGGVCSGVVWGLKGGYAPNGVSDYKVVSRPFSDYL
jgi:hypothetical protein